MVMLIAETEKALAGERDSLVKSILSLEDQYSKGDARTRADYLEKRHRMEQRLIQVMDELTRLTFKG
jgi:hypothetical protein